MTVNPDMFAHPAFQDGQPPANPQGDHLWAGKYKTPEEMEKGYLNLQTVENANRERLDRLEAQLGDPDMGRVNPGERSAARKRPEEVLNEIGIPSEPIGEFIVEKLNEALTPIIAGARAREDLTRRYPDFVSQEPEIAAFISQSPEMQARYQRMFRVDQGAAMEWARDRFLAARGAAPSETANEAATRRLDARLPGGTSGPTRGGELAENERLTALQSLYERGMKTGDWSAYMNARINETITDTHVNRGVGG